MLSFYKLRYSANHILSTDIKFRVSAPEWFLKGDLHTPGFIGRKEVLIFGALSMAADCNYQLPFNLVFHKFCLSHYTCQFEQEVDCVSPTSLLNSAALAGSKGEPVLSSLTQEAAVQD